MSNVFKKIISVGVTMSTMLWSVGVSALVPVAASAATCPTLQSGSMVKAVGRAAIYAVNASGKVLYFPSGDEFKSWNANESYGGYTSVTQECFDAIYLNAPTSAPFGVNFRPGAYVVKRASSDQLYVVLPGNKVAKITTAAANALYGTSRKTMTVQDVFWPNYTSQAADITEAKVHPGMLVSNGGKNWYVDADSKLWEVTAAGFTANRFKAAFVRPVTSAMIANLATGGVLSAELSAAADRTQTGGGSTVITPPTGAGALSAALAASNPAGTTLADSTAHNPVLRVTLTAGSSDVKVTGFTLNKGGFIANTAISGVEVLDSAGMRHGNVASSVNADNQVTLLFSSAPITVRANSSETVTFAVNLGSVSTNGTLRMSLAAASAVQTESGASVSGAFPVSGNEFTIYDGSTSVASVTLDASSIQTNATLNVDELNWQDIAKFTLAETSSKERVLLKEWTLYNNGTAGDTDIKDIQLVAQDGSVLSTAQQVNKNIVFKLASSYPIDKGLTKTFTVRAKIVGGAARTLQFTTYNDYDVVLMGETSLAGLLAGAGSTDTSFPIGDATNFNKVTIGSGSVSFNRDATSPTGAVTPGASAVTLAKFYVKPSGENMELRKIKFGVVTGTTGVFSGNLTVRVNGSSVLVVDPKDSSKVANSATVLAENTLSSYPTLVAGQNNYITVEGNINTNATSGSTSTVYLDLTEVKRVVTNDITDPSVGVSAGYQISIQAAALRVTTQATPIARTVVVGTTDVELANIEFNAGAVSSGEDVKVTSVIVSNILSGGGLTEDWSNFRLYKVGTDGTLEHLTTSGNTSGAAASTTFTFTSPVVVPKAGSVILRLKGDAATSTSGGGTNTFVVVGLATQVASVGKDNGNDVTETFGVGAGQGVTMSGSGTLTLSLLTGGRGAPSASSTVTVGQTNVPVFGFKLNAQNEAVKLTRLTLTASGTISTVNDIKNLKLYLNDATTPFATGDQMSFQSTTSTSFTWTATDNLLPSLVEPGTSANIYVTADIGSAGQATLGDQFTFKINSSTAFNVTAKGASSGATLADNTGVVGAPAASAGYYITPFQVLVSGDAPAAGSSVTQAVIANTQIARIKIQNNGSARISITGIKFTDSGSHTGASTSYTLKYSDQNSTNYTGYTATSTDADSVDFKTVPNAMSSTPIDGGAYRYFTVSIRGLGVLAAGTAGDNWQLSIARLGDVVYTIVETDLGYSGNPQTDSDLSDTTTALVAEGRPSLGTIVKQ